MTLKIIGTGFGRTGTSSLKRALQALGFGRCYHMTELFQHPEHVPHWATAARGEPVDWDEVFEGFQAIVDWPGSAVWQTLGQAYPDAKFIHSERPAADWLRSFSNTIRPGVLGQKDGPPGWSQMVEHIVNQGVFGGRADDDAVCLEVYEAHNAAIRDAIPPDRLLIFQPTEGWAPLCAFLNVPIPDMPYPHENTAESFKDRMRAARDGTLDA